MSEQDLLLLIPSFFALVCRTTSIEFAACLSQNHSCGRSLHDCGGIFHDYERSVHDYGELATVVEVGSTIVDVRSAFPFCGDFTQYGAKLTEPEKKGKRT